MKLLSIAIPCYNSEAYMEKCIESLLKGGEEVEILVALAGRRHGLAGEVDSHPEGGGGRGEQVARATADLEDSLSRRHPRLEHPVEVAVVIRALLPSLRQLLVVRFVESPGLVPGAPG